MTASISTRERAYRWVAYLTLVCMAFSGRLPSQLHAECCEYTDCNQCVIVDQQDCNRDKTAKVVAGATIIALIAGAAVLACGCSGYHGHSSSSSSNRSNSHHHHDSYGNRYHSSYYSYYASDYDSEYAPRHSHHSSSHKNHSSSHWSSRHSDRSSSFWSNDSSNYYSKRDPQFVEVETEGNRPLQMGKVLRSKSTQESVEIAGAFTIYPTHTPGSKARAVPFVRLPDGTVDSLGSIPLSQEGRGSLSFGPYAQKGEYFFGLHLEDGSAFSSQTKVASVELNLNGSTVESRDFYAPAHAPSYYEPAPLQVAF